MQTFATSFPLDLDSEAVTIFLLYRYVRSDYEERNFSRRVLAYLRTYNTRSRMRKLNVVPTSQDEFEVHQVTLRAVDVWQLLDSIWKTKLYSFRYVFIKKS